MFSWLYVWVFLRWLVLATWVAPAATVVVSLLDGRAAGVGTWLALAYSLSVLFLAYWGSIETRVNALAWVNSVVCLCYLVRYLSISGAELVRFEWFALGFILRWSAVVSLGRCVTWDRLDYRREVRRGIYRWVDHPMTLGMLCYSLAVVPVSFMGWLAWWAGVGAAVLLYWLEDIWFKETVKDTRWALA